MPESNKKLQKLASAIYLITGFFAEQEPLRWRLRSLSTDLVSDSVKDKSWVLREINHLIFLAKNAGLVSEPNYEVMFKELSKVENSYENQLGSAFPKEIEGPVSPPLLQKIASTIKDNMPKKVATESGAVSLKKNNRQTVILDLLKKNKEIMIKDVSPLISGCSEKTIQRELLGMVAEGILVKKGEKRWSRYALA